MANDILSKAVGMCVTASAIALCATSVQAQDQSVFNVTDQFSCESDQTFCSLPINPSPPDIEARLNGLEEIFWVDGAALIVLAHRDAEAVSICCGLQQDMIRAGSSNYWFAAFSMARLDEAFFDIQIEPASASSKMRTADTRDYRGPNAVASHPRIAELSGGLIDTSLTSEALAADRMLTIYQPPPTDTGRVHPVVYLADGQSVAQYAHVAEALASSCQTQPVVLVGLWSRTPPLDEMGDPIIAWPGPRNRDYLWTIDEAQFLAHERFLLEEVLPLAEQGFAASDDPENRMLYGASSGSAWALSTGLRNPSSFKTVAAASFGWPRALDAAPVDPSLRFILSGGIYEPGTSRRGIAATETLQNADAQASFTSYVSGHSPLAFEQLFADALIRAFPADDASCDSD
jgi:enterochelin esterase-like enzyme